MKQSRQAWFTFLFYVAVLSLGFTAFAHAETGSHYRFRIENRQIGRVLHVLIPSVPPSQPATADVEIRQFAKYEPNGPVVAKFKAPARLLLTLNSVSGRVFGFELDLGAEGRVHSRRVDYARCETSSTLSEFRTVHTQDLNCEYGHISATGLPY